MSSFQPRPSFRSPRFAQPATFMRLPHVTDLQDVDVAIVGVPFDGGVSYRSGARFGPREIRAQSSLIRLYNPFQQVSPFELLHVADCGDIDAPPVSIDQTYEVVEREMARVLEHGAFPMTVGGDHSLSLPLLRAVGKKHGAVGLIQFDAHLDTWDEYFGGKYFHGTPFRRAIEEGLVDGARMIQIGIRGSLYGADDIDFQRRHGVSVVTIDEVKASGVPAVLRTIRKVATGAVYVTFDIDGVDPAFAPGTGTPEVGGLTSHEAMLLVRGLEGLETVGFDIVEVAPPYDGPGHITSLLAANLMFEFLCTLTKNPRMKLRKG